MHVDGVPHRSIRLDDDGWSVRVIDQTALPFRFRTVRLASLEDAARAIRDMVVRGAPLIGATAAYGMALALRRDPSDAALAHARRALLGTRPTAVNLRWAVDRVAAAVGPAEHAGRAAAAYRVAAEVADEDVARNRAIGEHGLKLIRDAAAGKARDGAAGAPVNVLTHCNAGWLATVDLGTATAPVYLAHDAGVPVHVWVSETRPRNQGAALTAWELGRHGVPHTLVADNAAGHLMATGRVDLCLVGADRITARGDVANKVGTYLKALAALDTGVPFYVAAPSSSVDWSLHRGADIPVEERPGEEVASVPGWKDGDLARVRVVPDGTAVANPAFDVTPARLVTGIVTERGLAPATGDGLRRLFPELAGRADEAPAGHAARRP